MKLRDYLNQNSIPIKQFATSIGVSPSTIEKIVYYHKTPGLIIAQAIVAGSNGAISYEDLIAKPKQTKKIKKTKLASWDVL